MRINAGVRVSPRRPRENIVRDYAVLAWLALVFVCALNPPPPFHDWAGGALAFLTIGGAFVALSNARPFLWIRP